MRYMNGVVAHLACFCPIGLVLLGAIGLHPIRLGQRLAGNESQLSGGQRLHEVGYLRYTWGCSSLVEYKGLWGFGGFGVRGGRLLEDDVRGWKDQQAACNWVNLDEKA